MADIKEYYANSIEDTSVESTESETASSTDTSDTSGVETTSTIRKSTMPSSVVAKEVINSGIDTQKKRILSDYGFSESGSLQIGKYVDSVSGDIRISPNGIVARNINGVETVTIDGTSGDASFRGTVVAGSVITGAVTVGSGTGSVTIDGANNNIVVNDGTNDRILIGYQSGGF
jgi:hypothetical protein